MAAFRSPDCLLAAEALLGEGPVWVEAEQALYWLDIKGLRVHRHRPATNDHASWATPLRVGSLAPRASGGFIAGTERGFFTVDADFSRFEPLLNPEAHLPGNRFNDGKVDRQGRFWAGTMDDAEQQATGALYRLDADLRWTCADEGYQVTNGPAFSPDGRTMYHSDSARQTIYRFDMADGGAATHRRVLARFELGQGYPDGMTVDAEGCLWVAFWDGCCLRRLSPDGAVIAELPLPVERPTSCTFGGPDLDRLFITSARIDLNGPALEAQPLAGGLFVADVGVKGIAALPFAG